MKTRYGWIEVGPLAGATVIAPLLRLATNYRYHVELDFGALDESFRKSVLSALKQGYTTKEGIRQFLQPFFKEHKFICGYIGKAQAYFPMPTGVKTDEVNAFRDRVRASCVMAGVGKEAIVSMSTVAETLCVSVAIKFAHHNRVYTPAQRDARVMIEKKGDQLMDRLYFLKGIASEIGNETFPQREAFYNKVLNREVIQVDQVGRYEFKERSRE